MYGLLIFALVASCRAANVNKHLRLLSEMDNNIEPNLPLRVPRRFLSITKSPAALTGHQAGTTVSLLCEAFGAPAPSIRWFKNNLPVYEYDQESNEIFDTNPASLARVVSTLLVSRTEGRDEYTCVAVSGAKTARVTSVVYSTDRSSTDLIPDRARLIPLAPQILVSYKVFMDLIGNNVVLPCHARGHPRPQITWENNRGASVKSDSRMKVLRSGELVISPLLWSDMGEFTCHVSNAFGSQLATTFVYPTTSVSRVNKVKQ